MMKTILVVEDEPAIALVLRLVLEDEGFAVVLAATGAAA
jgi:CheY-like chemotaxis protein